jgi:2-dehydropantoate 2-reductase
VVVDLTRRERVLVWGAGAIGGTVAAYLARARCGVVVVDADEAHVGAIQRRGLAVTGPIETFTQALPAFLPGTVAGQWDLILLAVKALHTEEAVRQLAPHLAPDGAVVSLQNGFNEIAIADLVGRERTVGAFINFGADLVQPGVVQFAGRGAVVVGELDGRQTERLERIHRLLCHFEPEAMVTDNIWGYLWGKMGYGAVLFATALTPDSIVEVLESREARPVLTALAREVMTVAAAAGVKPMGFNGYDPAAFGPDGTPEAIDASFDAMIEFNRRSAKTHTGVWRDIAIHHRKTECEAQFKPLIKLADAADIEVPHLDRLMKMMRRVERGKQPQARENIDAVAV